MRLPIHHPDERVRFLLRQARGDEPAIEQRSAPPVERRVSLRPIDAAADKRRRRGRLSILRRDSPSVETPEAHPRTR